MGVGFAVQVQLLGRLAPDEIRGACRHLYRDRMLMFGQEDYMIVRLQAKHRRGPATGTEIDEPQQQQQQQLRVDARIEKGHEPATVLQRILSCLEAPAIAARFGLKFFTLVQCKQCATLTPVTSTNATSKCVVCRQSVCSPLFHAPAGSSVPPSFSSTENNGNGGNTRVASSAAAGVDYSAVDDGASLQALRRGKTPGAGDRGNDGDGNSALTTKVLREFGAMHIPFETLKFIRHLGQGGYGQVSKMLWQGATEVAVKALKSDVSPLLTQPLMHLGSVLRPAWLAFPDAYKSRL